MSSSEGHFPTIYVYGSSPPQDLAIYEYGSRHTRKPSLMALNTADLMDYSFGLVVESDNLTMGAWSGVITSILSATFFAPADFTMSETVLRAALKAGALDTGVNENTFESYIKSMFVAADKLVKIFGDRVSFLSIRDNDTAAGACADVEAFLYSMGVHTGGAIRDWSKQPGLEAFNPNAAKEKRDAAKAKAGLDALAMLRANRTTDSATIVPVATSSASTASALETALAAVNALLTEAEAMAVLSALNSRLASFQVKPEAAPMLPDNVEAHPLSALGKVTAKRAKVTAEAEAAKRAA